MLLGFDSPEELAELTQLLSEQGSHLNLQPAPTPPDDDLLWYVVEEGEEAERVRAAARLMEADRQ